MNWSIRCSYVEGSVSLALDRNITLYAQSSCLGDVVVLCKRVICLSVCMEHFFAPAVVPLPSLPLFLFSSTPCTHSASAAGTFWCSRTALPRFLSFSRHPSLSIIILINVLCVPWSSTDCRSQSCILSTSASLSPPVILSLFVSPSLSSCVPVSVYLTIPCSMPVCLSVCLLTYLHIAAWHPS